MEIARDYDASFLEAVKKGLWKDLNERYSVSMYGTVYDKERDKIVKPWISNGGYELIGIKDNGKWRKKGVHQLVWEAFNGKVPEGYEINHKDENKENNVLSNLNLLSHRDNCNFGTRNEKIASKNDKFKSKPVIQKSLQGEIVKVWGSSKEVERQMEYNSSHISACCRGERKTHKGYIWQYEEKATA